jgi:hypothetical protein
LLRLDYSCAGTMMAEEDAASRRERLISLRLQAQQFISFSQLQPISAAGLLRQIVHVFSELETYLVL